MGMSPPKGDFPSFPFLLFFASEFPLLASNAFLMLSATDAHAILSPDATYTHSSP